MEKNEACNIIKLFNEAIMSINSQESLLAYQKTLRDFVNACGKKYEFFFDEMMNFCDCYVPCNHTCKNENICAESSAPCDIYRAPCIAEKKWENLFDKLNNLSGKELREIYFLAKNSFGS